MSTRHIVHINPLHSSILITVIYVILAIFIFLVGAVLNSISSGMQFGTLFDRFSAEELWSALAINLVLVFAASFLITSVYNWLAKYLGGIEITLDDD